MIKKNKKKKSGEPRSQIEESRHTHLETVSGCHVGTILIAILEHSLSTVCRGRLHSEPGDYFLSRAVLRCWENIWAWRRIRTSQGGGGGGVTKIDGKNDDYMNSI